MLPSSFACHCSRYGGTACVSGLLIGRVYLFAVGMQWKGVGS